MKLIRTFSCLILFSLFITSCKVTDSGASYNVYESSNDLNDYRQSANNLTFKGSDINQSAGVLVDFDDKLVGNNYGYNAPKKIQYSANYFLSVKNIDSSGSQIKEIAKKYNGYANEIGTYRAVIRVERKYFEQASKDVEALGRITSKNIRGKDVTEQYFDLKIRLENAEKARSRYLELLTKAENVEATLKVEVQLERLNEKIELLKGKMNKLNHLTAYSTININLSERKKPGVLGYIGIGLYRGVKWFFVRN